MADTALPAVVYFSKSGHTRRAAEALARIADADLIPATVKRYRIPILWIVRAIFDIHKRSEPKLFYDATNLDERPWLALCGPVWASQPSAPLRSMLAQSKDMNVAVGLLLTSSDQSPPEKIFAVCDQVLGRPLSAKVHIENTIDGGAEMERRLTRFASELDPLASRAMT